MAGFKAHITGSTLVGIGYGIGGYCYGVPWPTCVLGGGLCSVSGMLPDLDSGPGKPLREMTSFAAAVVPALMIPRFITMGWGPEQIALAAMVIYGAIRFGVAELFKRYTVHRGMWHSFPAAAIVGLLAFMLVSGDELVIRLFKSGGVTLGFLVHLVMDEIWSIELDGARIRLKKSFGTALKFWNSGNRWSNFSTYGKLIAVLVLVIGDPYLMNQIGVPHENLPKSPQEWIAASLNEGTAIWEKFKNGKLVSDTRKQSQQLISGAWSRVMEEGDGSSWQSTLHGIMEPGETAEPGTFASAPNAAPVPSESPLPLLRDIPQPAIETATRPQPGFESRY
jgi:membrane-bound metal-dependent hydrolase YbcI (DUF457 family)